MNPSKPPKPQYRYKPTNFHVTPALFPVENGPPPKGDSGRGKWSSLKALIRTMKAGQWMYLPTEMNRSHAGVLLHKFGGAKHFVTRTAPDGRRYVQCIKEAAK